MQLFSAIIALSTIAVASPLERRQAPAAPIAGAPMQNTTMGAAKTAGGINMVMPNGFKNPPAVPVGSDNAPWVTYLDPTGNWHTQRVNNPTALLNGNYVVTAINNVNICSGNWAFLYRVTGPNNYPQCKGNFGQYNTGDTTNGARPGYNGLKYGTCPGSVFHWGVGGNKWGNEAYSNCWTGYWNWGQSNDGVQGTSTFPNGMRVGYCCFN